MKDLLRKLNQMKTKSIIMRISNGWSRHPMGMSAKILQWFTLDLEPPSCGRVLCSTALGEKPFYNL